MTLDAAARRAGALLAAAGALSAGGLAAAGVSPAAPVDVSLRVEGLSGTLYEGPLTTFGGPLDGGDGSGSHACNAGESPASALAASGLAWRGRWNPDFQDFFLDEIAGEASDPSIPAYWSVLVGWRYVSGVCRAPVAGGGEVLLALAPGPSPALLRLTGPARVGVGESFAVTVRDGWIRGGTGLDGGPVAGASVAGATTAGDGRAVLRFDNGGLRRLKATLPGAVRSNALDVCVGDERCEGAPPPPREPDPSPLAVVVPAAGERYAPGGATRLLRGRATGSVSLALGSRHGRRCAQLTPAGTFAARRCDQRPTAIAIPAAPTGEWRLRLRERLTAGRYRLVARSGSRVVTRRFTVAHGPPGVGRAATLARRWLIRAQNRDGSFGPTPRAAGAALFTDWAAIALTRSPAAGRPAARALDAVRRSPRGDLATLQRAALALAPSKRRADRVELGRIRRALAARQRHDGSWHGQPSATAYALIALSGSRHGGTLQRGRAWLADRPLATDADTIGATLWALRRRAPRRAALAALRSMQTADGGFAALPGEASNAQSTALAVVGLLAAGIDPHEVRADTGISALDYLRARQRSAGRVVYRRRDLRSPVWVTAQAALALNSAARRLAAPRHGD